MEHSRKIQWALALSDASRDKLKQAYIQAKLEEELSKIYHNNAAEMKKVLADIQTTAYNRQLEIAQSHNRRAITLAMPLALDRAMRIYGRPLNAFEYNELYKSVVRGVMSRSK